VDTLNAEADKAGSPGKNFGSPEGFSLFDHFGKMSSPGASSTDAPVSKNYDRGPIIMPQFIDTVIRGLHRLDGGGTEQSEHFHKAMLYSLDKKIPYATLCSGTDACIEADEAR
jgi:hypothetical protein